MYIGKKAFLGLRLLSVLNLNTILQAPMLLHVTTS